MYATADYEMSAVVMMLMMGVLAGAKHMSHLLILKADQAIRKLFGRELFPDASIFFDLKKLWPVLGTRYVKRMSVHDVLARKSVHDVVALNT